MATMEPSHDLIEQHWQRVRACLELHRWDLARRELEEIVALDPASAFARAELARCHACLGDPFAAVELAEQALSLAPDDEYVLRVYAAIGSSGKQEDTIDAARRAVDLDPTNPDTWYVLAFRLDWLGQALEAHKAANQCLKLMPEHCGALRIRANCQRLFGRHAEAEATLLHVLQLLPEDTDVHAQLGRLYGQLGKYDRARFHLAEAMRSRPGDLGLKNQYLDATEKEMRLYRCVVPWPEGDANAGCVYRAATCLVTASLAVVLLLVGAHDVPLAHWAIAAACLFGVWTVVIWFGEAVGNLVLKRDPVARSILKDFRHRRHLRQRLGFGPFSLR